MIYKNSQNEFYTGGSITIKIDNGLFSGIPTEKQLKDWGYEVFKPSEAKLSDEDMRQQRMEEIIQELRSTDYIVLMDYEGEDTSQYKGWREARKALRAEYRRLSEAKQEEK